MCRIKSRHGVLESNFSLWYSTSTDNRSDKIQMFHGQFLHFCKNCIAWASCWIPACVLVFPLAVMTPGLFAYLICSKEKIVADWYTFQSTILQQQFWNQASKLNYKASYTQCDYSQWQYWWNQKTSSNKIWICFYDPVDMQPFFDQEHQHYRCLHRAFWFIWAPHRCLCSRAFSSSQHVWRSIYSFIICC